MAKDTERRGPDIKARAAIARKNLDRPVRLKLRQGPPEEVGKRGSMSSVSIGISKSIKYTEYGIPSNQKW